MNKSLLWVGSFVLAFVLLFLLQRVTSSKGEESAMAKGMQGMASAKSSNSDSEAPGESSPGKLLVTQFGCMRCHGGNLAGTEQAPSLLEVSKNYDRATLINYLRKPSEFMDKDRYKALKAQYPKIMPDYGNKDVKDLGAIADYLLGLK